MSLIRLIPERHRGLVKELVTFGTVGGINTALGQVMFNILLGLGALTANTISTAIATVCSFILNRHVTYRHRARTSLKRELPLFALLNLIGLGIQLAILGGAKHAFGLHDSDRLELNIARFGAVLVGTVFLLLTYRTFVFKKVAVPAVVSVPHLAVTTDVDEFAELTEPLEAEFGPALVDSSTVDDAVVDEPATVR